MCKKESFYSFCLPILVGLAGAATLFARKIEASIESKDKRKQEQDHVENPFI